jgi:hypothetical protein
MAKAKNIEFVTSPAVDSDEIDEVILRQGKSQIVITRKQLKKIKKKLEKDGFEEEANRYVLNGKAKQIDFGWPITRKQAINLTGSAVEWDKADREEKRCNKEA